MSPFRPQELLWICPKFINTGVQRELKAYWAPKPSTKTSDPPQDGHFSQQWLPKTWLSVKSFKKQIIFLIISSSFNMSPQNKYKANRLLHIYLIFFLPSSLFALWVFCLLHLFTSIERFLRTDECVLWDLCLFCSGGRAGLNYVLPALGLPWPSTSLHWISWDE